MKSTFAWPSLMMLVLSCLGRAHAASATDGPRIEGIEGSATVSVRRGQATREARSGAVLAVGDRIQTTDGNAATIAYADGSRVLVNRLSDYEIEGPIRGTEWNRLRDGSVRGVITKAAGAPTPTEKAGRLRFLIRTRSATMGVRGTDFVMGIDPRTGVASVHTLEGVVDVAPSESALLAGKGTPLTEGQALEATRAGLGPAKPFDRASLLGKFSSGASPSSLAQTIGGVSPPSGVPMPAPPIGGFLPFARSGSSRAAGVPEAPPAAEPAPPPFVARQEPASKPQPTPTRAAMADEAQRAKEADHAKYADGGHRTKIFNVQPALFWSRRPDRSVVRALNVLFTPTIAFPAPLWPYVRGAIGGTFFENGKQSPFLTHEYLAFGGTKVLRPIFVEAGWGWRFTNPDGGAGVYAINAGWVSNYGGALDRLFVGTTRYVSSQNGRNLDEFKIGLGLAL